MMQKLPLIVILTMLLSIAVFAQKDGNQKDDNKSDLSGTWELDENASLFSFRSEINGKAREAFNDYVLEIAQHESSIKIVKSFSFKGKDSKYDLRLFDDKRGEKNRDYYPIFYTTRFDIRTFNVDLQEADFKSETTWKKGRLIRSGSFMGSIDEPPYATPTHFLIKENYALSGDGKILTVQGDLQIMETANVVTLPFKLIFRKKAV